MDREPKILEEEAYLFLYQEKFDEAFGLFRKAGDIYRGKGNHKQAAICLAAAGSSWGVKCGEKTFYNSALCYEEASNEAERAGDYEYASLLYKYAAANYERDMELFKFAECFYKSKECRRKFLTYLLLSPKKNTPDCKNRRRKRYYAFCQASSFLAGFDFFLYYLGPRRAPFQNGGAGYRGNSCVGDALYFRSFNQRRNGFPAEFFPGPLF